MADRIASWTELAAGCEIPWISLHSDSLIAAMALSQRDQSVLDFERSWWLIPGPKARAIQENLDMSATQYYRILRRLVDDVDAAHYDPLTVRRLQRSTSKMTVRKIAAEGEDA